MRHTYAVFQATCTLFLVIADGYLQGSAGDLCTLQSSCPTITSALSAAFDGHPRVLVRGGLLNSTSGCIVTAHVPPNTLSCLIDPPAAAYSDIRTLVHADVPTAVLWASDACSTPAQRHMPLQHELEAAAVAGREHHSGCDVLQGGDVDALSLALRHTPVVLRNVKELEHWQALNGSVPWSWSTLRAAAGVRSRFHVKVAPDGVFEGSEALTHWCAAVQVDAGAVDSCYADMPRNAYARLQHAGRIVGRPASMELTFDEFMALCTTSKLETHCASAAAATGGVGCDTWMSQPARASLALNLTRGAHVRTALPYLHCLAALTRPVPRDCASVSADVYIEYASLAAHMPQLLAHVRPLEMARELLLRHTNLWLSGGRTVGKLHMDAFENLMVPIRGSKTFLLWPPSAQLPEGHMREGRYGLVLDSAGVMRTRRSEAMLMESTSIVNSPLDVARPEEIAAEAPDTIPALLSVQVCHAQPGDVLYVPSFWWHEVVSTPDEERKNAAVNFWYEPVLRKPFPCAHCPLLANGKYASVLSGRANDDVE